MSQSKMILAEIGYFTYLCIMIFRNIGLWDIEFSPASIAYDFRHEFKAAFRLTATKKLGGVPVHFEVVYVHSGYDRKVSVQL